MNIAKLIAKFVANGFEALTVEEKTALHENADLMEAATRTKFADAEAAAEDKGDETGDEELDEKGLRELIAKSVKEEAGNNKEALVAAISDQLVAKFFTTAGAMRKRAIDTGKKPYDANRDATRKFFTALLHKDFTALNTKATDFNEIGDNEKGAYLIPTELRAEILRIAQAGYGIARSSFMYLPFSGPGNERKIPTLKTSVVVNWTDEAAKKKGSNPTFGVVTQTLKKLAAIIPFTEEILEDSAINLTQLVATLFVEAASKEEDVQFFMGTGSPWTGILKNSSVNLVTLGAGEGFADVTADDLLDMIDETPASVLPGAKFYLHRHMLSQIRKLKDPNTGAYIFQRPSDGLPGTIWDYQYVLCEAFPGKTTAGAHAPLMAFGNLNMAAIYGDKQQIRAKVLDQATITDGDGSTVINLAEQDMIALRLEERVGYVLALPEAVTVLRTGSAS